LSEDLLLILISLTTAALSCVIVAVTVVCCNIDGSKTDDKVSADIHINWTDKKNEEFHSKESGDV